VPANYGAPLRANHSRCAGRVRRLGTQPTDFLGAIGKTDVAVILARLFTLVYFGFFVLMPWYSRKDKTKPVPERVRG